jgi:cytochrome c556
MNLSSVNARRTRTLLLTVVFVVVVGLAAAFAQSKRNRAAKEFMREKLELSQRVLEGVATEDYELIIAKGTRLSAMSQEVDWRVFENPDYDQQSTVFRRHVDSLVKAARNKDLDAATLAYVRVTMSCVDCHRLVRGKLVASGEDFPLPNGSALSPTSEDEPTASSAKRGGWQAANLTQAINGRTTAIRQN